MYTLGEKIIPREIEEEIKDSYISYAMSVIVGRALPDVRDGLKPVHRRILYGMQDLGLDPGKPYKKAARIVGEILGKYHPHGDIAVFDALVRMVQDFSLRYPLIDGQGNFGSVDGDAPAAMRYVEARLAPVATELLSDIDKDTVDFVPNFDGSLTEPKVLPSRLPNLLVNGSSGIAVGMATNIPPHNLSEVVDAACALIDNPEIELSGLTRHIRGPDFPTGAIICGRDGIKDAYQAGRGSLRIRAKAQSEQLKGNRQALGITELPYQVNKATLLETIAKLVQEKTIEGISDLRDESDKDGMRVVIELKRDANDQVVLNQLYKHTQLETTFGIIMLALVDGRPRVLGLKALLQTFVDHRKEIIVRRTRFELARAQERAHILEGLKKALAHLDAVIKTIRQSKSPQEAKEALVKRFDFTEKQAQAILEMQLQRLTALERDKIEAEYLELIKKIEYYQMLLKSEQKVLGLIKEELQDVKKRFGDPRRTEVLGEVKDFAIEDLIAEE
ncbi:MAG: DNA topoisomerase 4 subunit A, partial [Candidatus Omnitrophica bacterium]|nr:DNA topoisomerase 4 subunit A [Candidatus Omnitrophota bacterium]